MQYSNIALADFYKKHYESLFIDKLSLKANSIDIILFAQNELLLFLPNFVSQLDFIVALNDFISNSNYTKSIKSDVSKWCLGIWSSIYVYNYRYHEKKINKQISVNPLINTEVLISYLFDSLKKHDLIENDFDSFSEHFKYSFGLTNRISWKSKDNELYHLIYWLIEYNILAGKYIDVIYHHFTHYKRGNYTNKGSISASMGKHQIKNKTVLSIIEDIKAKFCVKS